MSDLPTPNVERKLRGYLINGTFYDDPHVVAALDAAEQRVGVAEHELSLIEADTKRGITDCSTPVFQRVRNIVEQLEKAEQREQELRQERDRLLSENEGWSTHALLLQDERDAARIAAEQAERERDEARTQMVEREKHQINAVLRAARAESALAEVREKVDQASMTLRQAVVDRREIHARLIREEETDKHINRALILLGGPKGEGKDG